MSYVQLYVEGSPVKFAGARLSMDDAKYVVLGVGFDSTSSYSPGSRFAPLYIREASQNIESNSFLGLDIYIEEVPVADIGDLAVVHGDAPASLERVASVVTELVEQGKIPVVIGGEHTITYGIALGYVRAGLKPCLLVFDAHLDLRDEYLGYRYSHASALRRTIEELRPQTVVYVGARAYERSEKEYAESRREIQVIAPLEVLRVGPRNVASRIRRVLSGCDSIHLSFDIDGIDPAYAPGTGTPEPLGLSVFDVFRILGETVDKRFVGMDMVEVNPLVDQGNITSILAARIIQ
jgi:agmatinase